MRDLLLIAFIGGTLLTTVRYPFAALLLWGWFTLATPQQAAYLASQLPLNMIIAGVTFVALFFHGEFSKLKLTGLSWLIVGFGIWIGVSQEFSLWSSYSAEPSDRFIKILIFVFLCAATVTSRLRFHALLWLLVLVMGFYGAKGGMFTILTFGQAHYYGLDQTILYDNNHMGIALAVSLPLFIYLAHQAANPWVRMGMWMVTGLSIVAIVGTQSRGAFLSLIAFGGLMWLRSSHKLLGVVAAVTVAIIGYQFFLPDHYKERMATITTANEDASFTGRTDAWTINWRLAKENPLTGAGMRVPYTPRVAATVSNKQPRAAHSIYFEVLGGTGFVGLFLYVSMLAYGVLTARKAERIYAGSAPGSWRSPFARYAQMSLIIFGVGGASVSMEMWEGYLIIIALISSLARIDINASTEKPMPHIMKVEQRKAIDPRERIKAKLPAGDRPRQAD